MIFALNKKFLNHEYVLGLQSEICDLNHGPDDFFCYKYQVLVFKRLTRFLNYLLPLFFANLSHFKSHTLSKYDNHQFLLKYSYQKFKKKIFFHLFILFQYCHSNKNSSNLIIDTKYSHINSEF